MRSRPCRSWHAPSIVEGPCEDLPLCHDGLGGNGPCDECMIQQDRLCDGSSIPGSDGDPWFSCCLSCASESWSSDVPGQSSAESDVTSCDSTPPLCQ